MVGFLLGVLRIAMSGVNFHSLINFIPEPLIALDMADEVVFVNQEARKFQYLTNRPFEIGVPISEIIVDNRKEMVNRLLSQVKKDKRLLVTEAEFKDPSGKAIYFEAFYSPVFDEHHDLKYVTIVFRDITHEKVFQKRATQLLHDYSGLIENANAMIFSIDSRGYITEWNNQCAKLTQFTKNDALAQRIENFVHDSNKKEFDGYLKSVFLKHLIENFELYLRTKDDQKVHLLINATLKFSGRGEIVGVLFVGQDITELTTYRNSLEEIVKDRTEKLKTALDKEKELVDIRNKFVSMASHEFRIPLSNISSSVSFVRSRNQLSEESIEKLGNIDRQVGHMRSLIDDVLAIGKAETGKIIAKRKPLNLIEFLEKIIEEVSINAQHSHVVNFDHEDAIVEIESDEKLLRNIFINLISNAIKFSPDQGEIRIHEYTKANFISVSITDRGIGIKPEDQKRIFEPFNRGVNAESIKGTGLGLSIVKRAVEALDGIIELTSIPQTGTTFTVKFKV
jgi:PAS domain S-box-containing protein